MEMHRYAFPVRMHFSHSQLIVLLSAMLALTSHVYAFFKLTNCAFSISKGKSKQRRGDEESENSAKDQSLVRDKRRSESNTKCKYMFGRRFILTVC